MMIPSHRFILTIYMRYEKSARFGALYPLWGGDSLGIPRLGCSVGPWNPWPITELVQLILGSSPRCNNHSWRHDGLLARSLGNEMFTTCVLILWNMVRSLTFLRSSKNSRNLIQILLLQCMAVWPDAVYKVTKHFYNCFCLVRLPSITVASAVGFSATLAQTTGSELHTAG